MDTCLDCVNILATENNAAVNTGVQVPVLSPWFQIFLHMYLEVELLDHMVVLCLSFWGIIIPFSIVAAPFYISTSNK